VGSSHRRRVFPRHGPAKKPEERAEARLGRATATVRRTVPVTVAAPSWLTRLSSSERSTRDAESDAAPRSVPAGVDTTDDGAVG
jgi:hypothetical protein